MRKSNPNIKTIFGVSRITNCVYVVKDKKGVIYVGHTEKQSVQTRLSKHLDSYFSSQRASIFSAILFKNNPKSFDWCVETFTIGQTTKLTGKKYDCLKCAEQGVYDYYCQNNHAPVGNKTRPRGCRKDYMVKGAYSILPAKMGENLSVDELYKNSISTIFGKFCLAERLDEKNGTNIEGYDCIKTSKFKCDFCTKQMEVGDDTYYVIDYSGEPIYSVLKDNIYCSINCLHKNYELSS